MLTLALDTSTRAGSVAVIRGDAVLAVVYGDASRTHGERLPAELDRALQDAGCAPGDLELLAVASGPGAFTGLRIGLAAVQGLAMVLNVPVIAVSALDALALAARVGTVPGVGDSPRDEGQSPGPGTVPEPGDCPPRIAAWMDAQRGEVFAAWYSPQAGHCASTPDSTPIVGPPDVVLAALPATRSAIVIGDGAVRYRAQILQAGHRVLAPPLAIAPYIARLGVERAAHGEAGPPHALQPLYVRRPDAELERARRLTHDARD